MNERTTDLELLELDYPFAWGIIVKLYELGPYVIGAYHPWLVDGRSVKVGTVNKTKICYHVWVDRKSAGISLDTLEGAIVSAISLKYDGVNSQAAYYFLRMIGKNDNLPGSNFPVTSRYGKTSP